MTAQRWTTRQECGAKWAAWLMIRLALGLGWRVASWLLWPVTLYYLLRRHEARAASRAWLARVLPQPPGWRDVFRHFRCFAAVMLDRVFLLTDRAGSFRIDAAGIDLLPARQGAILIGAHLGSFAVLRAIARQAPVTVQAFMFRRNQDPVAQALEAMAPDWRRHIIEAGAPDAMLRVAEALARGELVGMLADRAPDGGRMIAAPFLGQNALFPAGPLLAAALLKAPVLLFYGVRTGPRRYSVHFEPFAFCIASPREARMAHLEDGITGYARRLEALCRMYPFNWFNFYDFWDP